MSAANFNLRSWNSKSSAVRGMAKADSIFDNDETSKILGMRWDAIHDTISFPERPIPVPDTTTKREILQHTSIIYDPLGLLTPVNIRAKIILQELWQMNYTWDTPLPSDLQQKWTNIAHDMNCASSSTFSRYLFNDGIDGIVSTAEDSTLHVFSDASTMH